MDLKKSLIKVLVTVLQTAAITGIVLFAVLPVSCKVSAEGIKIIGGDYRVPVLEKIEVLSCCSVQLSFSDKVKLNNLVVSPFIENISDSYDSAENGEQGISLRAASGEFGRVNCNAEYSDDGRIVNLIFENETEVGKKYEIYGVVSDRIGNTLTFCIPFTGYNSRVPQLMITEVHNSMAGQLASEKESGIRRLEYVEFLALSDGNLVGLELCNGYAGEDKKYVFPPVEVKKGEVFLVHMRNWGNGCISEEDDNLKMAYSTYSGNYRDLWTENTNKPFGDKSDFIILRSAISGEVMDGLMYSDSVFQEWNSILKSDYSVIDNIGDVFDSVETGDAIDSTGLSSTKVLYRTNFTPGKFNKSNWLIGNASPGSL